MGNDPFVFTNHMDVVSNQLWEWTSIVGAVICFLVLLVTFILFLHPVSRPHLDRVSFRVVVWALVSNMVFGITNAIGGAFTGPTWTCGFTIFLLLLSLELSSFLVFCIALNLQLVVVHHLSGLQLEKYYIIGSIVASLCVSIPPYAANQYGWDPIVEDCWYSDPDPGKQLAWEIGTQLLWTLLTGIGEVVASTTVLVYMFRLRREIRRKLVRSQHNTGVLSVLQSESQVSATRSQHSIFADAYRGIIIRICTYLFISALCFRINVLAALYPLVSFVINLTMLGSVIYATTHGVNNMNEYRVLLLTDVIYGARPVIYGLLAAADPSLLRALQAFVWHLLGKKLTPSSRGQATIGSRSMDPVSVHIELTTRSVVEPGPTPVDPESLAPQPQWEEPEGSVDALPTCSKPTLGVPDDGPSRVGISWHERSQDGARETQSRRRSFEQHLQDAQDMVCAEDAFGRQI